MGEEHELKGLGSLGKKTPFYRTSRIQPLCAQVVHKRYYRLEERYYRLACSKQPNERENTNFWSGAVLPLRSHGSTALEWYYRSGAAVVPLWSGSKKLHPL